MLHATTACTFSPSQLPNVVWDCQFFTLLTSKCALHRHFFIISTSKSAPRMVCFVRFDFDMCFVPQRRATTTFIWPDGSAPAALASLLCDPLEPQIMRKTQWIATFLPFRAPASSFFWLFLLTLSSVTLCSDSFFWLFLLIFLLTLSLLWSSFFFSSLLFCSPPLR